MKAHHKRYSPLVVILRRKPKNPESPWIIIPVDPQGFGILQLRFASLQDDPRRC
jgi:hypothetical protein